MSDSSEGNWLTNYYNRIQSDCTLSIERRDRITRLSYMILAVGIAAYVGFFADGNFVIPLGRFGLVSGILFVLIRFFFQSMIAYGYFQRGLRMRTMIEQHWMNGIPSLDKIKHEIVKYDHGKAMPKTQRNRFTAQVKSGFILILAIPVIPLAVELHLEQSWFYYVILGGLVSYAVWEVYAFKSYDQMQSPKR